MPLQCLQPGWRLAVIADQGTIFCHHLNPLAGTPGTVGADQMQATHRCRQRQTIKRAHAILQSQNVCLRMQARQQRLYRRQGVSGFYRNHQMADRLAIIRSKVKGGGLAIGPMQLPAGRLPVTADQLQ